MPPSSQNYLPLIFISAGVTRYLKVEAKRKRVIFFLPVFLKGEPHVLLHLLEAMVISVNEVKGQRDSQGTIAPSRRHP